MRTQSNMPIPVFRKTVYLGDFSAPVTGDNRVELMITLPSVGWFKGEVINALLVGYAGDPMQIYKDLSDKIKIKLYVGEDRLGFVSSCNLRTAYLDASTGYLSSPTVVINNKDTSLPVSFFIENEPVISCVFDIDYSTADMTKVLYEMTFRGIYKPVRS